MSSRERLLALLLALASTLAAYFALAPRRPDPAPAAIFMPDEKWVIDRFHQVSYLRGVWRENRWLGVRAWQNPNDVWTIQEIISETRPDWVIETGTAEGGGALVWATLLAQANPAGRVITVDIEDKSAEARKLPLFRQKIEFVLGSSTAPEVVERIARRVAGKRALVILDSDHSRQHVLNELRAYAPLVPVGGYLIAQDTNVNGHPVLPNYGPGPWEAVAEFLASDDRFQSDRSRERQLFTMHPTGYLKRVR